MPEDEEPVAAGEFDPSVKKKKKKKKKTEGADDEAVPAAEPVAEEAEAEGDEDGEFGEKKKKKKKKKMPVAADDDEDDETFGTFDASKKKKKKPKKQTEDEDDDAGEDMVAGEADESQSQSFDKAAVAEEQEEKKPKKQMPVWQTEDRLMTYDEMLERIFGMLNPDISSKKAFKMKPPVVVREGTKRVVLVNFQEIVTSMNRTPEHLLSFMLAELGTSGSSDSMGRVTFKYAGRQAQKHMESVIKQYVKEYVLCKLCKSSDTKLNKDSATRLYFMVCGSCGASRSVNPIKSGFQAQIGKRKKKI